MAAHGIKFIKSSNFSVFESIMLGFFFNFFKRSRLI